MTTTPKALCYMAHPVSGDVPANLARAKRWLKALQEANPTTVIIAPWITACEIWEDADPEERAIGLLRDCYVIDRCDAVILVGGRISAGMRIEMNHVLAMGNILYDLTHFGEEPPSQRLLRATVRI